MHALHSEEHWLAIREPHFINYSLQLPGNPSPALGLRREHHRIVICFAIAPPLPTPPSRDADALTPAFRSNTFQNFKLSSAAVGHVSLYRLRQGSMSSVLTRRGQHLSVGA
jgi:hypothetical protein